MTKLCSMCKDHKSKDSFYVGQRRGSSYLYSRCKDCCKIINASQKDNNRDWELKKNYGITLEEYNRQCKWRENECDICREQVKVLHVDHNHITGKNRGYLCGSCNRGIGLLGDDPTTIKRAAKYLEDNN